MNIAFVSTAHIHTKGFIEHILKATDGRKVAAVWDDVAERGEKYAKMADAPFVADLSKLLADPKIDGFIICAENTRHLPLLKQVLPVGKPVFCEKPLVTTVLEDLQEVTRCMPSSRRLFSAAIFSHLMGRCGPSRNFCRRGHWARSRAFGIATRIMQLTVAGLIIPILPGFTIRRWRAGARSWTWARTRCIWCGHSLGR